MLERTESLTDVERAVYEWQLWVPGLGEEGQERLKAARVLVSRVGGLGSVVALELAAAGVGTLVLAHGGDIKASDLNRQLLMTHDALGTPRIASIERRLKDLNPRLETVCLGENVTPKNVRELVGQADLVVDCAPLFSERLALNAEAVRQGKPMVECAMYELQAQIFTILPGQTPCLACLTPESPPAWKREFPVLGAVSGSVGCIAAMEAIKVIAGFGQPLAGRMLNYDLRDVRFHEMAIERDPACAVCGDQGR